MEDESIKGPALVKQTTSPVDSALDAQRKTLSLLSQAVSNLENRLSGVLEPRSEKPSRPEAAEKAAQPAKVSMRISDNTVYIEEVAERIHGISSRLEV